MIKEFWNKLEKRQRYMVAGAGVFVFVVLLLELVIFPFGEAMAKSRRYVASNQVKLEEMLQLDAEFARHRDKMASINQVIKTRGADFSLFSYLEKKAAQARVKGNIKQMNTSRGTQSAAFEETVVDLRLEKITIRQLTDFLYLAESPADFVRIKRITVNKMKESPEYLNAQMLIASITAPGQRRGGK
jgi:general secretion pathway protein M